VILPLLPLGASPYRPPSSAPKANGGRASLQWQAGPSELTWPFEKNIFSLTLLKNFIYLILAEPEADSK